MEPWSAVIVRARVGFGVALVILVAFVVPALLRRGARIAPAEPRAAELPARRALVGTPSCSASVCHGGGDLGQPRSEAATWRMLDPHAGAYDTLLTLKSQAIAGHLYRDTMRAHEAPLCLKCHVHPHYEVAQPNFRKQDGVGCESCHGAAESWLKPHYSWKVYADKKALGFADTKSLRGRAIICVPCHVGTPSANVDHDLIAAGHPPLRFEFSSYLANLPPHWDVARDKKENSPHAYLDFEIRAWDAGHEPSLAASMDLVAYRADPANGTAWPEFADRDCFSCHHDLQGDGRRQKKEHLRKRRPGSLAWNEWYVAFTPGLFEMWGFLEEPGRVDIAKRATMVAKVSRASRRWPPVFPPLDRTTFRNWDETTHYYFYLRAVNQMHKDNNEPANADLERRIAELREELIFPPGYNGPYQSENKK